MVHLPMVRDDFVQPDLCGPCGGQCCKQYPGAAFPEDFGAPNLSMLQFRLVEAFTTGRWTVDMWDGYFAGAWNPKYVRPAVKGDEGEWMDRTWGGNCTFWSEQGCGIFDQRPTGCRGLEPKPEKRCEVKYGSKQDAIRAWLPYQEILRDLLSLEDLDAV